jgi:hypothetical protein
MPSLRSPLTFNNLQRQATKRYALLDQCAVSSTNPSSMARMGSLTQLRKAERTYFDPGGVFDVTLPGK